MKKVKFTCKKTEKEYTTTYGGDRRSIKRRKLEDGEEEKVEVVKRPGALGKEDSQSRIRHETDIKFKLLGKYLE